MRFLFGGTFTETRLRLPWIVQRAGKAHLMEIVMLKTMVTAASFLLAASVLPGAPVSAAEQPNLLIMGEDADQDTVPRNSRIFNRVLNAITSEMQAEGFKVFDEAAVSLNVTDPGRVRRTDAELITIARRIQDMPIDAIAVFQIYASTERSAFADINDLRLRIPGRLINVQTGQALANYEIAYAPGDLPPLPPNCNRDCVLEHVGDQARRIGADVGAVLARQLDMIAPAGGSETGVSALSSGAPAGSECVGLATAYTLVFRNFDTTEISEIEEYLASFRGYEHHRPLRASGSEASYWYETCTEAARLNRNLRLMVEHMGVEANLRLVGNRIEIDKIRQPRQR